MPSVLLTAFEPYEEWDENSSWLALVELTRWLEDTHHLTTRLYPVCFQTVRQRLESDLKAGYDLVLHLGQAPGSTHIRLESIGLNLHGEGDSLIEGAPAAYRSQLDLSHWQRELVSAGIPSQLSHHAGTFLCNATLFLTHHVVSQQKLATKAAFIHVPLAPKQAAKRPQMLPSMSTPMAAAAIAKILQCHASAG